MRASIVAAQVYKPSEPMAKQSLQIVPLQQRGRPMVQIEPWERINVAMPERHVADLDVISVLIRLRHH